MLPRRACRCESWDASSAHPRSRHRLRAGAPGGRRCPGLRARPPRQPGAPQPAGYGPARARRPVPRGLGQVRGRHAPRLADRAVRHRPARRRPGGSEPAARAALLPRPHGARLHAVGQVEASRRNHQGEHNLEARPRAALPLVRQVHRASDAEEDPRVPGPRAVRPAGHGPADGRDASPGQGLQRHLPRRRCGRGPPHDEVVRRLRPVGRQLPRGDRLRAGLARHRGLPRP